MRAIVNLALSQGFVGRERLRADADPRPLRRAGRRRDGLLRDRVARAAGRSTRRGRRRARRALGLRGARRAPALTAPRDARRRARRRARRADLGRRQLPRHAARPRHGSASAGEGAAAHPHGHRALDAMLVEPRDDGVPAADDDALRVAGRRHRDDHRAPRDPLSPEIPGHRIGEAREEWRIFDRARGARAARARRGRPLRGRGRDPRDIARVVPGYRGDRAPCASRATSSSGAARACAKAGASRRPTGARAFRPSRCPPRAAARRPASTLARGAASSSTRWSRTTRPADRRAARPPVHERRRQPSARPAQDDARVLVRSDHGELSGIARVGRRARQRADALARGQRAARARRPLARVARARLQHARQPRSRSSPCSRASHGGPECNHSARPPRRASQALGDPATAACRASATATEMPMGPCRRVRSAPALQLHEAPVAPPAHGPACRGPLTADRHFAVEKGYRRLSIIDSGANGIDPATARGSKKARR